MNNEKILEDIIAPLSGEQREAVISDAKYIRVIAGAGTGKTETLTRRIIYLLLYLGVEPKEIVAFTFTEKAAQNMKSRIYHRVKELKGDEACIKLGEMYVGTIHGYCLMILQDYFGYGEYDVLDENQEMAFIFRMGWNLGLWKGGNDGYGQNCIKFIRSINVVYNELINTRRLRKKAPNFYKKLRKYENLLDQHKFLTFARMTALAVQKIRENPEKLRYVKHLIVDEYQDINRAQEELIKLIGKNANVFIVGDPRQSIYQWRGSDERCFEEFPKHFKGAQTFTLRKNRRSLKKIVETANKFADTFKRNKYENITHVREGEGLALLVEFETPKEEAKWIISQIERFVSSGKCRYKDCAILLRSVKKSGKPFIDLLKQRKIPYIVGGKVGLFNRDEVKALGHLFSWLWDRGFWFENQRGRRNKIEGDKLLETGIKLWKNATKLKLSFPKIKEKLKAWKREAQNGKFKNFTEIFHELIIILGYKKLDPDNRLHSAIIANLGRFSTLLADYESSIRLKGNKPNWKTAFKGLCWYMNTYATDAYEEQQPDNIRGIDAVQIMTVHQAKGLEWPIVFIPCMISKRFPSSMIGREQEWFIPRNMFDARRYEGEEEDERRLLYVAITRARDILCITYFKQRSIFVEEIKESLDRLSARKNIPSIEISTTSPEDEIQTFSAGEILTYLKCPHFYRLKLYGYKPGLVEQLGYGKSLHNCLSYASDLIANGIDPEKAVKKAVDEKFHVPYAHVKLKENMKTKAMEVLTNFVKAHIKDMGKIHQVEARIEFPVQKSTIVGRVDVILKDGNTMEVRDYKTSDEVTTEEQSALQVRLYTLGLKTLGKPITRASIAYLESENPAEQIKWVSIEWEELQKSKETAENCIELILRGDFRAKPENGYCKTCDYAKICKWKA